MINFVSTENFVSTDVVKSKLPGVGAGVD